MLFNRGPQTHDYTQPQCRWGHNCYVTSRAAGQEISLVGWGNDINTGDCLLLSASRGSRLRYRIIEIRYFLNPPDMGRAKAVIESRLTEDDTPLPL